MCRRFSDTKANIADLNGGLQITYYGYRPQFNQTID